MNFGRWAAGRKNEMAKRKKPEMTLYQEVTALLGEGRFAEIRGDRPLDNLALQRMISAIKRETRTGEISPAMAAQVAIALGHLTDLLTASGVPSEEHPKNTSKTPSDPVFTKQVAKHVKKITDAHIAELEDALAAAKAQRSLKAELKEVRLVGELQRTVHEGK